MDFTLSEELTMIRDMARDFVTNELLPVEREVLVREKGGTRGAPIPAEKRAHLKQIAVEQGLWAMTVPEALGGGGLSALGACLVAEELGKTFVDFDFGDVPPILFEADEAQRTKFLAPAIAGEKECALAIREPGSDKIMTLAVQDGDDWVLNGSKLAGDAGFYLVFAQADAGVTCFIVDGIGPRDGSLQFENTRVPAAQVLGEPGGACVLGKKYQSARQVRAAARKLGIAARLLEMSWQYARDWKALGQALAVRPAVRRYIAEMAVELDAARWLVYDAACQIDAGKQATEPTLRASLFASEMVERAIDRTIEIHGGPAHAADLPMLRIYSGNGNGTTGEQMLELQRLQVTHNLIDS